MNIDANRVLGAIAAAAGILSGVSSHNAASKSDDALQVALQAQAKATLDGFMLCQERGRERVAEGKDNPVPPVPKALKELAAEPSAPSKGG